MSELFITSDERKYLRELAREQLDYSMLPIMKEREKSWYNHNDLKGDIPLIHFETRSCEQDLLPELECTSEAARKIELQIIREISNHKMVDDDRVVPSFFRMGWDNRMLLFNLQIEREFGIDSKGGHLGHHFKHPIKDLKDDQHLLKPTFHSVDRKETMQWKAFAEEILGDILPVKMSMGSFSCCLTQHVVHLMGMETMLYSMIDYPDEFHELMKRISDDYIEYFKWMEKEGLLVLNNGNNWLGQGSFGFTNDLPGNGDVLESDLTTRDLWLYMDSQETVGVSPEMFGEFFFPYYNEVAKQCGLLSYGCCEPVHPYWENYIRKLPGLRKVSVSPWCNEEFIGEVLKGAKVIYQRKPSPNFIGVGTELDKNAFRQHILKTLKCAKGCKLEFTFRDVYTLEGNSQKPKQAVRIIRELLENNW